MTAHGTPAAAQARRRLIKYPRREIVNAIRYVHRTGAAWSMLPHDLPPTALPHRVLLLPYLAQVNAVLRQQTRQCQGRHYGQSIGENHRKRGPGL